MRQHASQEPRRRPRGAAPPSTARPSRFEPRAEALLRLQREAGNQAVVREVRPTRDGGSEPVVQRFDAGDVLDTVSLPVRKFSRRV